jgi:hypothetical protein
VEDIAPPVEVVLILAAVLETAVVEALVVVVTVVVVGAVVVIVVMAPVIVVVVPVTVVVPVIVVVVPVIVVVTVVEIEVAGQFITLPTPTVQQCPAQALGDATLRQFQIIQCWAHAAPRFKSGEVPRGPAGKVHREPTGKVPRGPAGLFPRGPARVVPRGLAGKVGGGLHTRVRPRLPWAWHLLRCNVYKYTTNGSKIRQDDHRPPAQLELRHSLGDVHVDPSTFLHEFELLSILCLLPSPSDLHATQVPNGCPKSKVCSTGVQAESLPSSTSQFRAHITH